MELLKTLGFKDVDIHIFFSSCSELKKKKIPTSSLCMLLLEFLYGQADLLDNTPSFPQAFFVFLLSFLFSFPWLGMLKWPVFQPITSLLCLRTQKSAVEDLCGAFQATHEVIPLKTLQIDCFGWMFLFTFVVFLHQTFNFVFKLFILFKKNYLCVVSCSPARLRVLFWTLRHVDDESTSLELITGPWFCSPVGVIFLYLWSLKPLAHVTT